VNFGRRVCILLVVDAPSAAYSTQMNVK